MITLFLLMASITINPIADAVQRLSERTPIGSAMRTSQWANTPLALRERGQWSAGIEEVRVMQTVQDGLMQMVGQLRDENGVYTDRSKLIADIGRVAEQAGLTPQDPALQGTIQDPTRERRAALIVDTQTEMAYGYANWKAGQDPDALEAAPAQELIRVSDRNEPRDWQVRWNDARGKLGSRTTALDGRIRMAALKNDPIWEEISRFGTPWPPYDFNSGMGVEDLMLPEAMELGLVKPGQTITPSEAQFNEKLEASVQGLPAQQRIALKDSLGPQLRLAGEKVEWETRTITDVVAGETEWPVSFQLPTTGQANAIKSITGVDVGRFEYAIDSDAVAHIRKQHGNLAAEAKRGQVAVVDADLEALPQSLLQDLTVRETEQANRFALLFDAPDGNEVLSYWEVRPGKGIKRRMALVTYMKYAGRAPRAADISGRRANVLNVPGIANISPAQARVNPNRRA